MFTAILLINTSITSHSSISSLSGGTLKMYSLRKFQVYNTVLLTAVTMLHIRPLELIHESVQHFANVSAFSSPPSYSLLL